jgi:hypothetical protein
MISEPESDDAFFGDRSHSERRYVGFLRAYVVPLLIVMIFLAAAAHAFIVHHWPN